MIPASKNPPFERLFSWYNEHYLLKRHFHTVGVRGEVDVAPEGVPILYIMNHSSWWDGMLAYHAVRRLSVRSHYIMMDEQQMRKYRFFRKIGAFSVDKTSRSGMAASLRYATSLLERGDSVWLYPQGDIYHLETRPLQLQGGAGYLLSRCPHALVVPVTAYYTMAIHQKPDTSLWFGEPIAADWTGLARRGATEVLAAKLEQQLDAHRSLMMTAMDGLPPAFRPLTNTGRSTSDAFDSFKKGVQRWKSFFGR